jgi:hypothetical protein
MFKDSKKVMILSIVLGAVGLVGGGLWFYLQWSGPYSENELTIVAKKDQVDKLLKMKAEIGQLEADVERLKLEAEELQKRLPDVTEVAPEAFLETLQGIAQGINDRKEDPAGDLAAILITAATSQEEKSRRPTRGAPTTPPQVKKVSYEIVLDAGFTNLILFLNQIETYERYIQIDSFDIVSDGQSPMQMSERDEYYPRYNMTMTVTTWVWVGTDKSKKKP